LEKAQRETKWVGILHTYITTFSIESLTLFQ
jgi:hypothetical protein